MSPLFFFLVGGMVKITEGYGENTGTKYRLLNKIDY